MLQNFGALISTPNPLLSVLHLLFSGLEYSRDVAGRSLVMDGCIEGEWLIGIYEVYGRDWGGAAVGGADLADVAAYANAALLQPLFRPQSSQQDFLPRRLTLNRALNKMCSGGKSQDYGLSKLYAESTGKMVASNTSAKLKIDSESFDVVPLQSIQPEPEPTKSRYPTSVLMT